MPSMREKLPNIGILPDTPVSYNKTFASRPSSLRQAIRSMDAPQNWQEVSSLHYDKYWTDEVQGVAWDGANWIFSCNASQGKLGHHHKAIYVFKGGQSQIDNILICCINYKDIPHPIAFHEDDDHWGQLCYYDGYVYVSHFWESGSEQGQKSVVVFRDDGRELQYLDWIKLEKVTSSDGWSDYPEFQAINPWDGLLYTCRGGPNTREFYSHYRENTPDHKAGEWTGNVFQFSGGEKKALLLRKGVDPVEAFKVLSLGEGSIFSLFYEVVDLPSNVQGACFSPNGHLYIACDVRLSNNTKYKAIAYFSSLNGHLMGIIPVLAEKNGQELEGICYWDGSLADDRKAQIHAVLLENVDFGLLHLSDYLDNIFFKNFAADLPEIV